MANFDRLHGAVATLVPIAVIATLVSATTPAIATTHTQATPSDQAIKQERVCRDLSRPGSHIAKRVCGTPSEVTAYVRQDFEANATDPLIGSRVCWRFSRNTSQEPCSNKGRRAMSR